MSTYRSFTVRSMVVGFRHKAVYASEAEGPLTQPIRRSASLASASPATAVLQGLCDTLEALSRQLREGDEVLLLAGLPVRTMLPGAARADGERVRSDQLASPAVVARFTGIVRGLHRAGVATTFREVAPDSGPEWKRLDGTCHMTFAMAS